MNKVLNSYLLKYTALCVAAVIALYYIVDANVEISTVVFSLLGAWKIGEWLAKLAEIVARKWHGEVDE